MAREQSVYRYVADKYREHGVFDIPHAEGQTSEALLAALAKCPLAHRPGCAMTYGLGTDVLGLVVERLAGQSLEEFATARVFEPLGMTDSHWTLPPSKLHRLAELQSAGPDGRPEVVETGSVRDVCHFRFEPEVAYSSECLHRSGGGGMVSTVDDYATFLRFILATLKGRGGDLGLPPLLSQAAVRLMCQDSLGHGVPPHKRDLVTEGQTFGLGFAVVEQPAVAGTLCSAGTCRWAGIFGTEYFFDPEQEIIAVLMTQRYPNMPWDLRRRMPALVMQAVVPL